jgi:hypothetical protein
MASTSNDPQSIRYDSSQIVTPELFPARSRLIGPIDRDVVRGHGYPHQLQSTGEPREWIDLQLVPDFGGRVCYGGRRPSRFDAEPLSS